jgi:hypothetical protein
MGLSTDPLFEAIWLSCGKIAVGKRGTQGMFNLGRSKLTP